MKKKITKKIVSISATIVLLFFLGLPVTAQSSEDFKLKYFVDEFGDATKDAYLNAIVKGLFSNSATTDSDLYVSVLISKYEISLGLFEYGSSLVKGNSYTNYMVKMKLPNGEVIEDEIVLDKRINRFILSDAFYWRKSDLVIFDGVSSAKFLIYDKERESNNYLFSIVFPSMDYIVEKLGGKPSWYIE
jgi:hypothetical protein